MAVSYKYQEEAGTPANWSPGVNSSYIIKLIDGNFGCVFPIDTANREYQEYLAWEAEEGNTIGDWDS